MALQSLEEALTYTQMHAANSDRYAFEFENGSDAWISFVAHLPRSFPRGGKFDQMLLRRVEFSLREGEDYNRELVLRQAPLLMEFDEDDICVACIHKENSDTNIDWKEREKELQDIDNAISGNRSLWVNGIRRIGKTSLLLQSIRDYSCLNKRPAALIYFPCETFKFEPQQDRCFDIRTHT